RICEFARRSNPVAAKRRLSFMPDEPRLFDYLTVMEQLQFITRIYGVESWEEKARLLVDELELGEKKDSLPAELSRGMKQKLVIAGGLLHSRKELLFDE